MRILYWDDIGMVCRIKPEDVRMDFDIFDIVGHAQDIFGNFTAKEYERIGATSSSDTTRKLDEAQPLLHGTIKWDACSHVYFGDEKGYIHLCGKENWKSLTIALERIFKEAGELLKDGHNEEYFV